MNIDTRAALAAGALLGVTASIGAVLVIQPPDRIITVVVGLVTVAFAGPVKDAFAWYFGSSKDSAAKTETIATMARNAGQSPGAGQ